MNKGLIQVFTHEYFGKVRTLKIDGEIFFVGKDVATSLKYQNTRDSLNKHVDSENKRIVDLNMVAKRDGIRGATFEDTENSTNGWIKNEVTVINISGLFSLILDLKMEKAKEYRHWVTSVVLPQIQATGSYVPANSVTQLVNSIPILKSTIADISLKDAIAIAKTMEDNFGVKHGIALAKSLSIVGRLNEIDLPEFRTILPPAEHEIARLNATQLGKKIGKSAQFINKKLLELELQELQIKDGYKTYVLTEKGKQYAEAMPFDRNGHSGYQIKWLETVMTMIDITH